MSLVRNQGLVMRRKSTEDTVHRSPRWPMAKPCTSGWTPQDCRVLSQVPTACPLSHSLGGGSLTPQAGRATPLQRPSFLVHSDACRCPRDGQCRSQPSHLVNVLRRHQSLGFPLMNTLPFDQLCTADSANASSYEAVACMNVTVLFL